MPRTEPVPLDLPTRRSIETVLRELGYQRSCCDSKLYEAMEKLRAERDALQEKLLNVPAFKKLSKQADAAQDRYYTSSKAFNNKVREVRHAYLAKGLTDEVRKQIEALVAEASKL